MTGSGLCAWLQITNGACIHTYVLSGPIALSHSGCYGCGLSYIYDYRYFVHVPHVHVQSTCTRIAMRQHYVLLLTVELKLAVNVFHVYSAFLFSLSINPIIVVL